MKKQIATPSSFRLWRLGNLTSQLPSQITRIVALALVLTVILFFPHFGGINGGCQNLPKAEQLPDNRYASFFEKAYRQYQSVPGGILEAVAYTNSRFHHITHNAGDPASCIGLPEYYGVMGLVADGKNYFRNNLKLVSSHSGISAQEIIDSPEKNILAYAAAYSKLQQEFSAGTEIEKQIPVLISLSELPDNGSLESNFAMNTHLYSILSFINNPACSEKYNFPKYKINLEKIFGEENLKVLSSSYVTVSSEKISDKNGNKFAYQRQTSFFPLLASSPDYPPALWNPAASCNYSTGRTQAISAVTIHDIEGSYAGAISWFQNCSASVSAHYVLRSSDGQITQMVLEANKAWHVGTENPYTIGLEHEGYASQTGWYTIAMYNSSAALVADICNSGYGIPPLRTGFWPWLATTYYNQSGIPGGCTKIKGHQHYPNQTHTDPGPNWNWDYYYKKINPQPASTVYTTATGNFYDSGGPSADYSNDERTVWTISPTGATSVSLTFNSFSLENTWDYIYVYNGTGVWAPLIGYYTGTTSPGTLVANSGSMTVEFRSDCATTAAGWNASWTSNSSAITPVNLSVTPMGCPNDGVTLTWQNSGANWYVDVSDNPTFSYFWNKAVPNLTSVSCPGGFCLNGSPCNASDYLGFRRSTTYYWRVWDGISHTAGNPFTTPNCIYSDTSCAGNFYDTGGPANPYTGNEDYTTIFQPTNASAVTMAFTSFDLELNYDSLWIINGQPTTGILIGAYTGTNSPGTVTANSGVMSIIFKADPFVNNAGWAANWTCVSTTGVEEQQEATAAAMSVFPNPFSSATTINYQLPTDSYVEIKLTDVLGRKIAVLKSEKQKSGEHTLLIDANQLQLGKGVYLLNLKAGGDKAVKKIVVQ